MLNRVRDGKDDFGYNALTGTYEPLLKAGVIDPTKVVRSALQNAASVAELADHHRSRDRDQAREEGRRGQRRSGGEEYDDDY